MLELNLNGAIDLMLLPAASDRHSRADRHLWNNTQISPRLASIGEYCPKPPPTHVLKHLNLTQRSTDAAVQQKRALDQVTHYVRLLILF